RVKSSTLPNLISGAGPGSGNFVLSIWAKTAEEINHVMISNICDFFILEFFWIKKAIPLTGRLLADNIIPPFRQEACIPWLPFVYLLCLPFCICPVPD